MRPRRDTENALGGGARPLNSRDRIYLLALLLPFVAYDLTLKAIRVASLPDEHGLLGSLELMRSDLLFDAGYALLWIGLFAVAREGFWRYLVIGLFQATTALLALVATGAHQFYEVTGSTLNFDVILYFLLSLDEVGSVAASEATPVLLALTSGALLYSLFGPWSLARLLGRRRGWTVGGTEPRRVAWLDFAGSSLAAVGLVALSLLPAGGLRGRASPSRGTRSSTRR